MNTVLYTLALAESLRMRFVNPASRGVATDIHLEAVLQELLALHQKGEQLRDVGRNICCKVSSWNLSGENHFCS
jgi:hypothetical protein